jgi:transcriptional regulator of acetoin/glycerol metabolism
MGLVESASGGWLFLDEISTLSPAAQAALLRVVENNELLPVGATKPRTVDIRVLSACNEPLAELVRTGRFRRDLWQRLVDAHFELPPLRARRGEIGAIVRHLCARMPGGPYTISDAAVELLARCPWENGNIRELRNTLRAMTELAIDRHLTPASLPEAFWRVAAAKAKSEAEPTSCGQGDLRDLATVPSDDLVLRFDSTAPTSLRALHDELLLQVIRRYHRVHGRMTQRQLSTLTGLPRSTLALRLKDLLASEHVDSHELSALVMTPM